MFYAKTFAKMLQNILVPASRLLNSVLSHLDSVLTFWLIININHVCICTYLTEG